MVDPDSFALALDNFEQGVGCRDQDGVLGAPKVRSSKARHG